MDTIIAKWSVVPLLLLTPALSLKAAQWNFVPSLYVEEMYSSNIERRRSQDETESFVTELTPGFALAGTGPRFSAKLNYGLTGLYYTDNSDARTSYHKANGGVSYSPWRPVSLYSSVILDQAVTNLDRGLSNDIVSRQGNITDREVYILGTKYSNNHGGWAAVDSDFNYRWVNTDSSDNNQFDNTGGHEIYIDATQGERWDRIFWTGHYDDSRESSDSGPVLHTIFGKAQVGYFFAQHWGLYSRYTYDKNKYSRSEVSSNTLESVGGGIRFVSGSRLTLELGYNSVTKGEESDYWNASLDWLPSHLTSIYASYDHRFYGESYDFRLSHGTRKLRNELKYSESVTTFSRSSDEVLNTNLWCPLGSAGELNDCTLADPTTPPPASEEIVTEPLPSGSVSNQAYLNKQWAWVSTMKLRSNVIAMTAYYAKREYGEQPLGQTDEKSIGVGISVDTRLNARSSLDNRIFYRHLEQDEQSGSDTELTLHAGYVRQLWSGTQATLAAEYNTRDSYNGSTDYDETRLIAGVRSQF